MKSKQVFPISTEQDDDGIFIVSCSMFKACHTQRQTLKEAKKNIEDVIELCIEEKLDNEK